MASRRMLAVVVALVGCGDDDAAPAGTTGVVDEGSCAAGRVCTSMAPVRGVDVLFVVDRSARMGPAQAKLARAMPGLVEALTVLPDDVGVRVGFVAAEDPVPPCPDAAEADLTLQSCRAHLGDFVTDEAGDLTASACLDVCDLDSIDVVPDGRPDGDGPWIEWDRHGDNLGGVDVAAALACAAPQGVAGCGFPAPIGATIAALDRFATTGRTTVAVIVSDAADCTLTDRDGDLVFDPDSSRTFWTDPEADTPMPAICWNAGVVCEGPNDGYASCSPADKDFAGEPANHLARVLVPAQATVDPGEGLDVVAIAGVPEGWRRGDPIPFADAEDPAMQREYGIGPGCVAPDGSFGLPPVRVHAFVDANPHDVDDTRLWSICADDWAPTMQSIAAVARASIHPSCVAACVADVSPTSGLQDDCTVHLVAPDVEGHVVAEDLPRCDGSFDDATVPVDATACWLPRTGDTMSAFCRDPGWNLELDLHWSGPVPIGAEILTSCTASPDRAVDCPRLP